MSIARMPLGARALLVCLSLAGMGLAAPAVDAPDPQEAIARRRAAAERVRRQYARQDAELRIGALKPSAERVGLFQKFELAFDLEGRYENPFDPDQIQVDATITRPDGSTVTVPAFFMAHHDSADGQTRLQGDVPYRPADPARTGWRLRYAPSQAGTHRIVLIAKQASPRQTTGSQAIAFEAIDSDHPGFVQVSKANPRYFQFSRSGSLFYPVGVNLPWTRTKDRNPNLGGVHGTYEHYFSKARRNMTATRVWQCHYGWIEWMPLPGKGPNNSWSGYGGLGYYNQMVSSAFDRVFEMAEEAGLPLMLVLDDNDEHDGADDAGPPHAWAFNPYNRVNGGPCATKQEVFSSPEARAAYRKRLRYIIARWGYSPSLWAINVWNDTNKPHAAVVDWLREMHAHAHGLAAGWRPMIFATNFKFEAQAISDYLQPAQPLPEGKPSVIQEVYYTRNNAWFIDTLRHELWQAMMRGHGGVMVWPHGMVDRFDAWSCFASVMNFVKDMPLHQRPVQRAQASVVSAAVRTDGDGKNFRRVIALANYGDVPNWGAKATEDHWVVDIEEGSQFLMGLSPKIYGVKREQWRTEPVFEFTLPAAGDLIVELGQQISGNNMRLVATDADKPPVVFELEGTERRAPRPDQKFLRIPLEAGPHKVKLSLQGNGSDWIEVRRFLVVYEEPNPARLLNVDGLGNDRHAMVFLRNVTCGELPQEALGQARASFRDVRLEVAGLAEGRYDVVVWDINSGRPRSRSEAVVQGGRLEVTVDQLEEHVAVKITHRP